VNHNNEENMLQKIIPLSLLSLTLIGCNDNEDYQAENQVFLSFYPTQTSFPDSAAADELVNFKRLLIANGFERVDITLNQRADGKVPLDKEGQPAHQYAVFRVSYDNSNTFDLYDEQENFLYTTTIYAEGGDQHYCIAIDQHQPQLIKSELEMRFPENLSETLDYITHCRELALTQS
jgi:hypothetical protein